jgi:predicted MPP superfamily phosphohydrolase
MRPLLWRGLINVPGAWWFSGSFLAAPWALLDALGWAAPGAWVPFALAAVGVLQSLRARHQVVNLTLDGQTAHELRRWPRGQARQERPLRVVQISDPHLGTFMSEARLRQLCQSAVDQSPDLILLTGDFMTLESQFDPTILPRALEPLAAMPGRVFACMGNHDHEAPEIVMAACRRAGVRMLVDEAALVQTEAGPVQILGADFAWRDRAQRLEALCAQNPRVPGALRLVMLHDPGAFVHLPEGEADLVLSGHTHGGQIGLVSLGLPWTAVSLLSSIPDHGFWARGRDRLYVHRGSGHYGFPLRIGVPAEDSLLQIHAP